MFFLTAAALFGVLSLGPYINLYEGAEPIFSTFYHFVASFMPYMTGLDRPWEYSLPQRMMLSISGGMGLSVVLRHFSKKSLVVSVAALVLLCVDLFGLSPAPFPLPSARVAVHPFYEQLATDEELYGIFDYPTRRPDSRLMPEEYYLYQTIHHKPIPHAIDNSWLSKDVFWLELQHYQMGERQQGLDSYLRCEQGASRGCGYAERVKSDLEEKGFRYFILHLNWLRIEKIEEHKTLFSHMFGAPVFADQELVVYRLDG